jgi:hypothetical protein
MCGRGLSKKMAQMTVSWGKKSVLLNTNVQTLIPVRKKLPEIGKEGEAAHLTGDRAPCHCMCKEKKTK